MSEGGEQHRAIGKQRMERIILDDVAAARLELRFEMAHHSLEHRVLEKVDLAIGLDQRAHATVEFFVIVG